MKITKVLWRQHIGRAIKAKWFQLRDTKLVETTAEDILTSMGVEVKDASNIINPPKLKRSSEPKCPPDWKDRTCLTYTDWNVLQEGIPQAQLLTKTIHMRNEIPVKDDNSRTDCSPIIENIVKRIIFTSTIFDAHQEKLPKLKDPERPAFNFPRVYGITNIRKICNLSRKLVQVCESLSGPSIGRNRRIIDNGFTSLCIEKESDLFQFALRADLMITSRDQLLPLQDTNFGINLEFPTIHPLHHSIGLNSTNTYNTEDIYPIHGDSPFVNIHTVFVHHNPEEVKNLSELPVRENQIHARSLIKAFTVAAGCARQKYGKDIKELPQPISVQCIQSDGQNFHFSVFQLNTLDIDGIEGLRNFWWSMPTLKLYEKAQYQEGIPVLEGYNPIVFKYILAFYRNN